MPTLSIREIIAKGDGNVAAVDVSETSQAKAISFYQYESLTLTVQVRRDGSDIQLPSDATVKLRAWVDGSIATLYIDDTGTIDSSGRAVFTLTDDETGFAAGIYKWDVRATQGADAGGVIASGDLTVFAASAPSGSSFLGPSSPFLKVSTVVAGTNVTIVESPTGTITISAAAASVADGSVTPAKLANSDFGDFTVASGVATIDAGAVSATKLASDAVTTAKIEDNAVTGDKINAGAVALGNMANLAAARVIGRAVGVGSGVPTALTSEQLAEILEEPGEIDFATADVNAAQYFGSGAPLTSLTAANLSGTIPTSNLGSGTANSGTYLRGDQTWATVSAGVGGTLGTVDNAIPRADGTGGVTAQASDLSILDASTSTANNVAITNIHAGQTNSSLVASPKGTGAFIVGPRPDGTITGGNARGTNAVDLQWGTRGAATQVASGANSILVGGERNTASGQYALAGGYSSTASTTLAFAWGDSATAGFARSVVFGLDSSAGCSADRVEQFKIRGDGGLSQQTAGGTYTIWGKVSSDPVTGIQAGDLYYNTTTNKMRCYNGTTWNDLF